MSWLKKLFISSSTGEQNKLYRKNNIDIDSIKENHKQFFKKCSNVLKVKGTMFSLKKLTRLLQVQMIINKWNQLTW